MDTHVNNQSHRILVIDDNTAIHDDFRKVLIKSATSGDALQNMESVLFGTEIQPMASIKFEIDCASQGEEGLEKVRQARFSGRPYALAFVDGRMPPGWDGIETISHLWQECPDLQVVLCTAYADYSWQEIHKVLGETDSLLILKKPFDNLEVLQLAHALTCKWQLNREVQGRLGNLDKLVRQRTEEKEQISALLEAALEHSPTGIIISDANDAKIRWANPAVLNVCDPTLLFSSENKISSHNAGWQVLRTDGTSYPKGELPFLRSTVKGEIIQDEEVIIRNAQGRDKWISFNAAPIYNPDGAIVAGILVFQDVTERKQSEMEQKKLQAQLNQSQKMESVGLLAGGVAHDFNNMLGVILGSAELGLMEVSHTEPVYRTLKDIQNAAQRSADLTRQLLAFARKQIMVPKILNLNDTLASMLKMLQRLIGEDIHLLWKPKAGLWPVRVDPSQIDQILANLCLNARDAIVGVGNLTIETNNIVFDEPYSAVHPGLVSGQYTMLSVSDDGQGIDKEILDRIFEPFFSTKKVGKGTGLGLSTVYGIVKQNNGFISVYSEPGKGSTFKIYLPRFIGEILAPKDESTTFIQRGQGEIVLLVEDQEDILKMSKAMLEKLGYKVLTANAPSEALRIAQKHWSEIQLLITDVVMPEMNGHDLAKNLVCLNPNIKHLFMSGYTANAIVHRGVLDEGVHFIQKPFSMKDLGAKISDVLDGKQGKL